MEKKLVYFTLCLLVFTACKTIQYVPVKERVEVAVHDTTYLHKTDTLVQIPETTIADYINVADTLRLEAPYAVASAWVDSTLGILKGRLVQGGKLPVQIVERERVVYKDSISYQEKPVPVEVEKIKKVVPFFWKFFSVIGILSVAAVALYLGLKFL